MAVSPLKMFNNQIESLLGELIRLFPKNVDLRMSMDKFSMLREMNAKKPYELFMKYIYKHKKRIVDMDESFFLNNLKTISEQEGVAQDEESIKKMFIMTNLWQDHLNEANKQVVWKYFQALIILSEKIAGV